MLPEGVLLPEYYYLTILGPNIIKPQSYCEHPDKMILCRYIICPRRSGYRDSRYRALCSNGGRAWKFGSSTKFTDTSTRLRYSQETQGEKVFFFFLNPDGSSQITCAKVGRIFGVRCWHRTNR